MMIDSIIDVSWLYHRMMDRVRWIQLIFFLITLECMKHSFGLFFSFEELAFSHVASLRSQRQGNIAEAWKNQKQLLELDLSLTFTTRTFCQLLATSDSDWLIPASVSCARDSRLLTYKVMVK